VQVRFAISLNTGYSLSLPTPRNVVQQGDVLLIIKSTTHEAKINQRSAQIILMPCVELLLFIYFSLVVLLLAPVSFACATILYGE